MKKIIFTFCTLSILSIGSSFAQYCGNSGPAVCTPQGTSGGGFQDLTTVPCAVRGAAYAQAIEFTMFNTFNFQGQQDVDSVEFFTLGNIPCGICWATNKASNRFVKDEDGCLKFTGTTNDVAGQYKLAFSLKAWINGNPQPVTVPASLAEQAGLKLFVRVKEAQGNCANLDTSVNGNNLIATVGCSVGIEENTLAFVNMSIVPNPMSTNSVVTFTSEESVDATMKLVDMSGKVVFTQPLNVRAGVNTTTIERNNLPVGVYFFNMVSGNKSVTKRFTIVE
jgi:hypothetical protein